MAFFLCVEVNSSLPPVEFRDRVVAPLKEALARDGIGELIDADPADADSGGQYELVIATTEHDRCRRLIADVLRPVDGGGQIGST